MRLVYSEQAVADLVRLRAFIAERDPHSAARVAADLVARMNNLCAFPGMGRSASPTSDPETIRDFMVGKYVVRYTLHDTALVVLRIWHHFEQRESGT